jgi:hypothetical protein
MGIQLTNPNIIDLTEWQKVVNEITYLSARIDAITTAQGSLKSSSTDWSSTPSFSQQFNLGSHKILFGRDQAVVGDTLTESGGMYEGSVNFAETTGVGAFSAKPIITSTVVFGGTTLPSANKDIILTLFNVSNTGFNYRVRNSSSSTTLSGKFYIHWTAIGPQ